MQQPARLRGRCAAASRPAERRRSRCWPPSAKPGPGLPATAAPAQRVAGRRRPSPVTGIACDLLRREAARPRSTDGCSIAETSSRSKSAPRARDQPGDNASALASVPPEVKITFRRVGADQRRDLRRAPPRPARGRRGPRHGPRTGCRAGPAPPAWPRAPAAAAARWRSSRDRARLAVHVRLRRHRTCHPPITGCENSCILPLRLVLGSPAAPVRPRIARLQPPGGCIFEWF